jgi:hypothetical protein
MNCNVEYALAKGKPVAEAREHLAQQYSRSCRIQSAYEAAAILANWDRANLERKQAAERIDFSGRYSY